MQTKLTKLLGIKYPIIQGPMAWVSDSSLASAVSNAGGAGVIASGGRDPAWLREEIKKTREQTNLPFGVNIVLMEDHRDELIQVLLEEKVDFVTLSAGNPVPYIESIKEVGTKVLAVVPNLKLAKRVEGHGADGLIIEGLEAGGHIGKETTMALMTQVLPEIDIPVVVAGGFADGRGLAAALVMGAAGVQMGTRFYASKEAAVHEKTKEALVEATETLVTGLRHNRATRSIKNQLTTRYLELEAADAPEDQLRSMMAGTSRKGPQEGDTDWGDIQAGQSISVISSIMSCQDIIETTIKEAREVLEKACLF